MSVGGAVVCEVLWQGVKWMAIAGAGILISLFFTNTAWVLLLGVVLFVLPPALHIIGVNWLRKLPGYMPQQVLYETMSCEQFMNYMAAMKNINDRARKDNVQNLLTGVHLWDKRKSKISSLSGGMKQRLLFAQACIGNPCILLLDEPTAGVDPDERENLQRIVSENNAGKIVILSTHILSDIENIAKKRDKAGVGQSSEQQLIFRKYLKGVVLNYYTTVFFEIRESGVVSLLFVAVFRQKVAYSEDIALII